MPTSLFTVDNRKARRLWLHLQGMLQTCPLSENGPVALSTIKKLGMVQLDSINSVARAHHHILWSRQPSYEPNRYNELLGSSPFAFEHFSHDAVLLPLDIYPYWRRQHQRQSNRYKAGSLGKHLGKSAMQKQIMAQIERTGPMCSRDFTKTHPEKADKSLHAWARPPHKLALDYLWLKGDLGVSHREGFIKYYDLIERLIPSSVRSHRLPVTEQIDFLCRSALERLGFATASEIQAFYDACDLDEVKHWLKSDSSGVQQISVQKFNGEYVQRYAPLNLEQLLHDVPEPKRVTRVISPFDPVARDRSRLQALFGMDYRIEIYTPAAKRRYGYYVYPVLEFDRMSARIDLKCNKVQNTLDVTAWWLEDGVKNSRAQTKRLNMELKRLARLAGMPAVGDIPEPTRHPL